MFSVALFCMLLPSRIALSNNISWLITRGFAHKNISTRDKLIIGSNVEFYFILFFFTFTVWGKGAWRPGLRRGRGLFISTSILTPVENIIFCPPTSTPGIKIHVHRSWCCPIEREEMSLWPFQVIISRYTETDKNVFRNFWNYRLEIT